MFASATLGTLATISGGQALDTGVAVTSQRLYNRGYRYYHPIEHTDRSYARPVKRYRLGPPGATIGTYDSPPPKEPPHKAPGAPRKHSANMSHVTHRKPGVGIETDKPHSMTGVEKFEPDVRGELFQNLRYGKLYSRRITLPPQKAGGDDDINRRSTSIYLKGIKIHRHFEGLDVFASEGRGDMGPAVMNWALIQFKCAKDPADDTALIEALKLKFFTQANDPDVWYHPYEDWPDNAAVTNPFDIYDMKHIHGTINQHTDFNILARKRLPIAQWFNLTTGKENRKTIARVRHYFKVPQRIYLEGSDNATWNHPIYEIWWGTPINPVYVQRNYPATGTAEHYNSRSMNTVYFKELKH